MKKRRFLLGGFFAAPLVNTYDSAARRKCVSTVLGKGHGSLQRGYIKGYRYPSVQLSQCFLSIYFFSYTSSGLSGRAFIPTLTPLCTGGGPSFVAPLRLGNHTDA
jgi:hypothetical protein